MPLTNSQYDAIMRAYDDKRQRAQMLLAGRREEIYARIPAVEALENEIASAAIGAARERVLHGTSGTDALEEAIRRAADEKKRLLTENGYPSDYLEEIYDCPFCHDTGFVGSRRCSCFARMAREFTNSRFFFVQPDDAPDLSAFRLDVYPDDAKDPATGRSARDFAEDALRAAKAAAEGICTGQHLFIHGQTGVGKTFLTRCIAKEAQDRGYNVLFFSAQRLIELLSDAVFRSGGESGFSLDTVLNGDLLILDDLGTEMTNTFVNTQLFRILSERIENKRTTIISTNLSLSAFRDTYSERIFSRVLRYFTIAKLCGEDQRLRTKLEGGTRG